MIFSFYIQVKYKAIERIMNISDMNKILQDKKGMVINTINWDDILYKKCKITLNDYLYDIGSENLIFYGNLIVGNYSYQIVLKNRIENVDKKKIRFMKNDEVEDIYDKYLLCNEFISKAKKININNIFVVRSAMIECKYKCKTYKLWIEEKLPKFNKMINNNIDYLIFENKIVDTNENVLNKFQLMIYYQTNKKYTICDLQGCCFNNNFILTDIEYTNTLEKFNMNSNKLLKCFEILNQTNLKNKIVIYKNNDKMNNVKKYANIKKNNKNENKVENNEKYEKNKSNKNEDDFDVYENNIILRLFMFIYHIIISILNQFIDI
jgi:hypothetical protein